MLRECPGLNALLIAGGGEVLARFVGLDEGSVWEYETMVGTMFWSWLLILGSNMGPCVRITGDLAGVVLLVLVVAMVLGGEESSE